MLNQKQANFSGRRIRNGMIFLFAICAIGFVVYSMDQALRHSSFLTGYLLMASFVVLTLFGMRKRFSFLPNLGSARLWMQVHIYVGLATFAMFGMHVAWRVPDGILETTLTLLFLIVGCSGIYGLVITRLYPKRLTNVGGEVIFERIPAERYQIAHQARELVVQSADVNDVLGNFYLNHLADFLERPRSWTYWLMPSGREKRQLVAEIADLDRYLAVEQREVGQRLSEIVERRDQLDYHHALQGRLKLWLFVHIGFTYSLLLLSIFHMILVHAFFGGAA